MPGQTVEDVCEAEARFVEEVAARHPDAEGKPCLIGNCQAGWQIMMMSAHPPRTGRADHAGRLAAVLLGRGAGQEPDALSRRTAGRHLADLAGRRPRQRHLRRRQSGRQFRGLCTRTIRIGRRSTTYIPRSIPRRTRFLEFEKWWGSPVLLNAEEMQCDRRRPVCRQQAGFGPIAYRPTAFVSICATSNRRSSCFAPWGDDITPPQQALGWITRPL